MLKGILVVLTTVLVASGASQAWATGCDGLSRERSSCLRLCNTTDTPLILSRQVLDHGVWVTAPAGSVPAATGGRPACRSWSAESSLPKQGEGGTVEYLLGDAGLVRIGWDNPFVGGNTHAAAAPDGYALTRTGGKGARAQATYTLARASDTPVADGCFFRDNPPRSTCVKLCNQTPNAMSLFEHSVTSGAFAQLPPEFVPQNSGCVSFSTESAQGIAAGGLVSYAMTVGVLLLNWNNPESGPNAYGCTAPKGLTCTWTGGVGNNTTVTFTLD